ncbi:MAG TPA: PIN domain-containing protein [Niabella sp.]|nr:PIN domain-containing protein [Niabella sp.]
MSPKVFLDANVLLDLLLKRNNHNDCEAIFKMVLDKKITGYITPSVFQVVAHWVNKAYGAKVAKDLLSDILEELEIIEVVRPILIKALKRSYDDVEGNIQYCAAQYYHIDYFVTNDLGMLKHKWEGIAVISPRKLLETIA